MIVGHLRPLGRTTTSRWVWQTSEDAAGAAPTLQQYSESDVSMSEFHFRYNIDILKVRKQWLFQPKRCNTLFLCRTSYVRPILGRIARTQWMRCGPIATDVARRMVCMSVCLCMSVCWADGWAVHKRLNRSRCRLQALTSSLKIWLNYYFYYVIL